MEIGYEAYKQGAVESLADRCHREHIHVPAYDYMRALACMLILLVHTWKDIVYYNDNALMIWGVTADSFSDLFFIISGCFLLPIRPGGTAQFFRKRLVRIVAPFFIYISAFIILRYLFGIYTLETMINCLEWMWLAGGNCVSWFMLVIISAYLFMPFISPWLWHATRRQVDVYLLIWLGASMLHFIEPYSQHLQWASYEEAGSWLRLFYNFFGFLILGYYLVRWPFDSWSRRRKIAVVSVCIAIIAIVYPFYYIRYDDPAMRFMPVTWYGIPAIAKFFLVYILMIRITKDTGWLYTIVRFIARYSYAIYLCHPIYSWIILPQLFPAYYQVPWFNVGFVLVTTLITVWSMSKIPVIGKYMR